MSRTHLVLRPLPVMPQTCPDGLSLRSLDPQHQAGLGELLYESYHDTIDDAGESREDARGEAGRVLAGAYGPLMPGCSLVVLDGPVLVSASVVTWHQASPLLAFSLSRPSHQRRGLARLALLASCAALAAAGHLELRLVVSQGNRPAERLYASLGFVPVPAPAR